jgi:PRC-barrel domain
METTPYASRLRYLNADDVDDAVVDYDGLTVRGSDSQKIGDVNGFVIDADARRVYYVVVDSGGWFTSRRFLLPIGHASLGSDRQFLQTDLTRETISRLPEFDEDRFRRFTDDELRVFERDTVVACCPDEPLEDVSITTWSYDTRRHYQQPAWWGPNQYAPERLRTLSRSVYSRTAAPTPPANTTLRDTHNQEVVVGREDREPGR